MKKNIFCFTFLLASSFIFLSCSKEPNVAPEADVELQSSIDASFANFIVTDIDMICSFIGENNLYPKFYTPVAGSPTFVVNRDPDAKQLSISFNKVSKETVLSNVILVDLIPTSLHAFSFAFTILVSAVCTK